MKKYDLEINDKNIIESIKNNYINRNSKLNKLIEILNVQDTNKVIAIDGKWGCGKTVFVKQLQMLNEKKELDDFISSNASIHPEIISKFREKYVTYYYNAWENDMHTSPLLSLIYNLINDFPQQKSQIAGGKVELPFNLKELLKYITGNAFDIDKVISYEDLAREIISVEEKQKALKALITDIFPKGKQILFIIDEIDRCKPTYSVELLENIKHLFNDDRIVFIISTNNEQLMHVIENFYGSNFDGYSYLNKFYDLVVELNEIDRKKYLENICKVEENSHYYNYSIYSVVEYFRLSMREINRLLPDFDLLYNYFTVTNSVYRSENNIIKYIFLPYCLALRHTNKKKLTSFLNGEGLEEITDFVFKSDKSHRILEYIIKSSSTKVEITENDLKETLSKEYNYLFGRVKNSVSSKQYEINEQRKDFYEIFSLLGNCSKIEQ